MSYRDDILKIVETGSLQSANPYVVVGIPDTGLVGSIACSHIAQATGMSEIGHVESDILPPVMIIHNNEIKNPIKILASEDRVIVVTEVILDIQTFFLLSKTIVQWAKKRDAKFVIGLTGIAVPNRMEIEKPAVYGVGSTDDAKNRIKTANITPFEEGVLVGGYALLMKHCLKEELSNITLLTESHREFPDPDAAAAVIEALNPILGTKIDIRELLQKGEEIRVKARELMRRTREQMRNVQKVQEQEMPGIYV